MEKTFPSHGAMSQSVALKEHYTQPTTSIITDLFTGGLCQAAANQSKLGKTSSEMVRSLLEGISYNQNTCEWSNIQKSIDYGLIGFTIVQSFGGALMPPGVNTLAALGAGGAIGYVTHQNSKC